MGSKAKDRRRESSGRSDRHEQEAAAPLRPWKGEGARLAGAFAVIEGVLGLLGLSRVANITLATTGMLAYILIRYRPVSALLRPLRSQGVPTVAVYALSVILLATVVGLISFRIGSRLGQTEGIRKTLTALNLPVRPLPPPPPRFPGHVDLDAFCCSEGPYQPVAPDEYGISIEWDDGTVSHHPWLLKADADKHLGKGQYIVCTSRMRNSFGPEGEFDSDAFRVQMICEWQYPGQDVKAIPPKEPLDIDGWRCQLPSGEPARWP